MGFKTGTQLLTLDGWAKVQHLEVGDILWSGNGISRILKLTKSSEDVIKLTGKSGISLCCTPHQTLVTRAELIVEALESTGFDLEFVQMGEEIKPSFNKIKNMKKSLCYELVTSDNYYVKVNEDTGIQIRSDSLIT